MLMNLICSGYVFKLDLLITSIHVFYMLFLGDFQEFVYKCIQAADSPEQDM